MHASSVLALTRYYYYTRTTKRLLSISTTSPIRCLRPFFVGLVKQRKNGPFKKAYELGVLCPVDIAVISLVCAHVSHIQHPLMNSIVDVVYLPLPSSFPPSPSWTCLQRVPNHGADTATAPTLITSDHHLRLSHHTVLFLASIVCRRFLLSLWVTPSHSPPLF